MALQSPGKCITGEDPAFYQLPAGKGRKSSEVGVPPRSIRPEAEHGEAAERADKTQPELINSPLWCWWCLQGDHTAAQKAPETN